MHNLINKLTNIENLAGTLYQEAADYFISDKQLSQKLSRLAEDEHDHFRILKSAEKYINDMKIELKPEFTIDDDIIHNLEKPLLDSIELVKKGNISKEDIIQCVYDIEFSELNEIFIYVLNTLKPYDKRFQSFASNIQDHRKRTEEFLSLFDEGKEFLKRLKKLPSVWKKNILFIDDSETILELLAHMFDKEYTVDVANNGFEGLNKIKDSFYNLIICDLKMPVMDGIEVFDKASEFDSNLRDRFVIFSGYINEKIEKKLLSKKIEFIIKPIDLTDLITYIKEKL